MALKFEAKDRILVEHVLPYREVKRCRGCHGDELESVLDLGEMFLPRWVSEIDYSLPRAPLHLVRCVHCGLLQLKHTTDSDLLFRKYWYRSSINATMREALRDVVKNALKYHKFGSWLDIGANDGWLISQVPTTFNTTACEPALDFADELKHKAKRVVTDYFGAETCPGPYDVITSCAMFYDLQDPGAFVHDIAQSLSSDGIWINQFNDSPTMLESNDFPAICHEHLTYWDVPTLADLYRQHGLTITDISHNTVNGGSVRVTARKSTRNRADILGIKRPSRQDAMSFAARAKKWKERMQDLCTGPFAMRGAWIYGASTKLSVMLQYLETTECFMAIADRNPLKYNLRLAGPWIPIVSEEAMRDNNPKYVLVGPWPFRDEFIQRERAMLDRGAVLVFPHPNIEIVL